MKTTTRKTTKAEMKDALDSFFWSLANVTGGTRDEILNQAPRAIARLEAQAAKVTELAANPSKLLAQDDHTMERAASVPARLTKYRELYVLPNVVAFAH